MQTTSRRTKKELKDETNRNQDEKLKKSDYTNSTPRDFIQKSTTADIYAQKKKNTSQNVTKTPKKVFGITSTSNISPMKGFLKSSLSSVSQVGARGTHSNTEVNNLSSARKKEPSKKTLTNVTINSPVVKRKLVLDSKHEKYARSMDNNDRIDSAKSKQLKKKSIQVSSVSKTKEVRNESTNEIVQERQRTKTRTLDEYEVKILKADVIDNNTGMINLSQKLVAQPKAFYINLDEDKSKPKTDKSSDEDVSYEDDFESYESDFESYYSDRTDSGETSEKSEISEQSEQISEIALVGENSLKDKDEEKMLDSGNFDLRDQRSAKSKPVVMDFILEDTKDQKTISLTDEGFQDMSSSSAGSSLKIQQTDRAIFIDMTKSKQNKQKRKIYERLQQRAKDLLGMITLHEMSYSLFEMQPISYDLYMATFGKSNYTQVEVQTFDDGITEEIQTEEVAVCQKWTQHPVEFSKSDVYVSTGSSARRYSRPTDDYLTKFTFMMINNVDNNDTKIVDENYKVNPLRVFLEQKDGTGSDEMLPYENYELKLKSNVYNSNKLGKFLKKCESRISHALSSNIGDNDVNNLEKNNKIPYSKGYFSLLSKNAHGDQIAILKHSKITRVIFSDTKANFILTVHKNNENVNGKKCFVCLWDVSVCRIEPIKYLTAIDEILIGKFRGNIKGLFIAALNDGSIHLWDLTEEPSWWNGEVNKYKTAEVMEMDSSKTTKIERDREWNLNNHMKFDQQSQLAIALQSCAFTSSGAHLTTRDEVDRIVGLEMNTDVDSLDAGRRIVGQILSLQRIGILTIWSIIQDKQKSSHDIGKAYLSKIKLEKYQTIHLIDHINIYSKQNIKSERLTSFNLNAAKRRLSLKKKEKCIIKNQKSRPQSAIPSKLDFDIDRPSSAASMRKKILPAEIISPKNWETGIVCNDLKVLRIDNVDSYLIARNCGEVLYCNRRLGAVKIERFTVATDTSSITSLEVSNNGLPYFLAATDTGTVNLCSLLDNRVLLTLDCRNVPLSHEVDRCLSDSKGRFISSVTSRRSAETLERPLTKLEIRSVHWSRVSPCTVHVLLHDFTLMLFELTHSDIYAKHVCENAAVHCSANDLHLALLTAEGEVQIHRLLTNESQTKENWKIFEKYVALL